ncbi:MAG: TRAM domain-containing protein [Rhodospirillaceae bacterium]|nr:TRAM domain-containing protein [Rhodospirillaceae bacterium]
MTGFRAEVTIESIGRRGDGVAALEGGVVHVPATAPGDRVAVALTEAGPGRFRGRLLQLLAAGPDRREPPCRHFGDCGGCALQHLAPEAYGAWKTDLLRSLLARNGLEGATVEPLHSSPPGSRRRAAFAIRRRRDDAIVGFNERHSHRVVDLAACPVVLPEIAALIEPLRAWAAAALKAGDRANAHVAMTDSGLDLLVRTAARLGGAGRNALVDLLARENLARVARAHPKQDGAEVLAEARPVRAVHDGFPIALAPGAFAQATADGEAALTAFALEAAEGAVSAFDLFCGSGAFALPLAGRGCSVSVADIDKAAIANLGAAARRAGLAKLHAEPRNLMRRPVPARELAEADLVVFDPPRAGAKAQAAEIAASGVPVVVAVSCDPGTFMRDARILVESGYRLTRLRPVDQFLWSPHLELAARFDFAG